MEGGAMTIFRGKMSLDEERWGRKIFLPCVEPILVLNIVLNSGLRGLTAGLKKQLIAG